MIELKNENRSSDWWMPYVPNFLKKKELVLEKKQPKLTLHPYYKVWYKLDIDYEYSLLSKDRRTIENVPSCICTVYSEPNIYVAKYSISFDLYKTSIEKAISEAVEYILRKEKLQNG